MIQNMIHTPEGVRDIYGNELARKKQIENQIKMTFANFGFQDIQTPTFEFFDIFSKEVGTTPSKDLYKFFDKEGNTLVLRPDFTPSIARCSVKYFMEKDFDNTMPVRLSYSGSAFANVSELQGKFKETTQLGVELIGDGTKEADAEVICMVIEALKKSGFDEFTVSVGDVDFFKGVCEEAGMNDETIMQLREYISVKNYFGAEEMLIHRNIDKKFIDILVGVSTVNSVQDLHDAKQKAPNDKSRKAIERLEEIYDVVEAYGLEKYISFDLGMLSKFHYYTGVIFKAYTYGVGDAIVKGGRYDKLLSKFGKDAPAVGCVFLLDDIMSALSARKKAPEINKQEAIVVYTVQNRKAAFEEMKKMRSKNISVSSKRIISIEEAENYKKIAEENGAEFVSLI